jgi:ATP-binding cassette subfamily F protein uup
VREDVGGYDDWIRQRAAASESITRPAAARGETTSTPAIAATPAAKIRKLSFKEQRELETLPALIETLEAELATLHAEMAQPQFYQQAGDKIAQAQKQVSEKEAQLQRAYERWAELE